MYQKIMVPLDGSELAEQALRPALAIAKATAARLELVHVITPGPIGANHTQSAGAYLDQIANDISEELNETVDIAVITHDDHASLNRVEVADILADHALQNGIDMIVIATKGRGGLARAFIGSVADALLRVAPCPLLSVRPHEGAHRLAADAHALHKILVGLDHTIASEQVLDAAKQLAKAFDAELVLLHVLTPVFVTAAATAGVFSDAVINEEWALRDEMITQYLEARAADLRIEGLKVSHHSLIADTPASGILAAARTLAPDIIAMASHAPRPIARAVAGSVTDAVVRRADCPLLITRQI